MENQTIWTLMKKLATRETRTQKFSSAATFLPSWHEPCRQSLGILGAFPQPQLAHSIGTCWGRTWHWHELWARIQCHGGRRWSWEWEAAAWGRDWGCHWFLSGSCSRWSLSLYPEKWKQNINLLMSVREDCGRQHGLVDWYKCSAWLSPFYTGVVENKKI